MQYNVLLTRMKDIFLVLFQAAQNFSPSCQERLSGVAGAVYNLKDHCTDETNEKEDVSNPTSYF